MDRQNDNNSTHKSSLPKAYDVEARERDERKRKRRVEGDESRLDELDTFPVMMSFKAFLETQDDYITDEEALLKYGEYKLEFKRQKLNEFFVSHKGQEWFRVKYHPQDSASRQQRERDGIKRRCDIFQELSGKGFLEGLSCDQEKESEIVKLLDSVVILLEGGNYEDIKDLDLEQNNNNNVKHKASSIFIKNIHPTVTRENVLEVVNKYPGFLRLAISEADHKNNFNRRAWVTFERNAKIREICFAINNTQLKGFEIQAVVNKDLSKRIRGVEAKYSADRIIAKDLDIALDILKFQDTKTGLWTATASPVEKEASTTAAKTDSEIKTEKHDTAQQQEEDEKTTEAAPPAPAVTNPLLDEVTAAAGNPAELKIALDKIILYLRIVHSIDFYNQKDYSGEDEMPNRCGLMHVRTLQQPDNEDETETEKVFNIRPETLKHFIHKNNKLEDAEAKKLGLRDYEFELSKFISANSQELAKDKWLCTLSGKKFKAVEYVKKHILNKFVEKIDEVKTEVEFFNSYILDPARPALPEEKPKPATRLPPSKKMRSDIEEIAPPPVRKGIHARLGVKETTKPTVRVTHATTDPRGLIDYSDIDATMFDTFG